MISDVLMAAGLIAITIGASLAYLPLGFMLAGATLVVIGFGVARDR